MIEGDPFDEAECRTLLARTQFGRVGLSLAAVPVVLPVRYAIRADDFYLAVTVGQLAEALDGSVIALQADGYHEDSGRRWTALAIGPAQRIGVLGERSENITPDPSSEPHSQAFSHIFPEVPSELLSDPWSGDLHICLLRAQIFSGRWIDW